MTSCERFLIGKHNLGQAWHVYPYNHCARGCLSLGPRVAQARSLDAILEVPELPLNVVTRSLIFYCLSLCCISLLGIAKELEPLLIAYSNTIAMNLVVWGENTLDSFLVMATLCTLSTSLCRSDPAQPPTEGAEGTAPGGGPPGPPPNTSSNRRLQQTQAQVEEVGGEFFSESFQIIDV